MIEGVLNDGSMCQVEDFGEPDPIEQLEDPVLKSTEAGRRKAGESLCWLGQICPQIRGDRGPKATILPQRQPVHCLESNAI